MSVLGKLTEGIVERNLIKEGAALINKWEKFGLLEGLNDERSRCSMALLLENQAKELLREATTMAHGDVEGFAAVAFPLVRRVFGGLIANELVSVQPMSLPSGLIFFLDFTYNDTKKSDGAIANESIYGGGVVGLQITGGVNLTSQAAGVWNLEKGAYSLNNGYTSPTGSVAVDSMTFVAARSGSGTWLTSRENGDPLVSNPLACEPAYYNQGDGLIHHDPDLSGSHICIYRVNRPWFVNLNTRDYSTIHTSLTGAESGYTLVRRLTREDPMSSSVAGGPFLLLTFATFNSGSVTTDSKINALALTGSKPTFTYSIVDGFTAGGALGSVVGTTPWGFEGVGPVTATSIPTIPEINIKVDSVAVTAISKKLKAKWTPELAQDLNAYHSVDAEAELTALLSEYVSMEIDLEILDMLIVNAPNINKERWSARLNREILKTGTNSYSVVDQVTAGAGGYYTKATWYQTLGNKVQKVSNKIHQLTLRGGANFMVVGPDVATILESIPGFVVNTDGDSAKFAMGVARVGSFASRFQVYKNPYMQENLILMGFRGNNFLETGAVYSPYIPLIQTPLVYDPVNFTPRRGVMTRYAKKIVRPEFYGLIYVSDTNQV